MDNEKLDDKKIKKILGDVPDIKDSRSKDEIITRLKNDDRLQTLAKRQPKRKKAAKLIPAFVAIAAVLVLTLLLPSILNGSKSNDMAGEMSLMVREDSNNSKAEMADDALDEGSESAEKDSVVFEEETDSDDSKSIDNSLEFQSAVYPEDITGNTVFHFGLAGDAATSVPVTFLIPTSQIEADFGDVQPTSFELYEKYADRIDEEAFSFSAYHPYKGSLSVEDDTIIHTLPSGHGYDIASGTLATYLSTLQDIFYGYNEIRIENEDGSLIEFDQVGEPTEPIPLFNGIGQFNYYLFKQGGQQFLSPNFRKSYDTLEMALQEMKVKPNDVYTTVIPASVKFEVIAEKSVTIVKFDKPLDLHSMDSKKAKQMIDGMLLTGASFDVQLKFENVLQSDWNNFNFDEPLPKPIGPNFMPFLLK